jgi:hypothetical protein
MEPWRVCRPIVTDRITFMGSRVRIRIKVEKLVWIRIQVMLICNSDNNHHDFENVAERTPYSIHYPHCDLNFPLVRCLI